MASITRNKKQSMGRSRGGLTSKFHALVDTNGIAGAAREMVAGASTKEITVLLPLCAKTRSLIPSSRSWN